MVNDISLKAENFKTSLINLINTAELPPILINYILKDVLNEIDSAYNNYIAALKEENDAAIPQEEKTQDKENIESDSRKD